MTAPLRPLAPVAEQLAGLLRPSLEQLLARGEALRDPQATPRALHKARLAAKALRYDLERFADLLSRRERRLLRRVKTLQELLGGVHDVDVQADRIRRLLDEHGKLMRRAVGPRSGPGAASTRLADATRELSRAARELPVAGLAIVLAELVGERARLRQTAVSLWNDDGEDAGRLRKRLRRALRDGRSPRS